jgi:hypothetical protein
LLPSPLADDDDDEDNDEEDDEESPFGGRNVPKLHLRSISPTLTTAFASSSFLIFAPRKSTSFRHSYRDIHFHSVDPVPSNTRPRFRVPSDDMTGSDEPL